MVYPCGCSISTSMFGEREVLRVFHCGEHYHLYSQDKTNRIMAKELEDLLNPSKLTQE